MASVCVTAVGWESSVTAAPATTHALCLRMDPSAADGASVCVGSASAPFLEPQERGAKGAQPVEISVACPGKDMHVRLGLKQSFIMKMQH